MENKDFELPAVNRQKLLLSNLIRRGVIFPLLLFSILCFIPVNEGLSLWEYNFDLPGYWRIIGLVLLIPLLLIYIFLDKFITYKKNKIRFSRDQLTLFQNNERTKFYIDRLEDLKFSGDILSSDEEDIPSHVTGRIQFIFFGQKQDFEVKTRTQDESKQLESFLKQWKEVNPKFNPFSEPA